MTDSPSAILTNDVSRTRVLAAYLLRGIWRAMPWDSIQNSRKQRLRQEFSDKLVPYLVASRSSREWAQRVAESFDVSLPGEGHESFPVEAWIPADLVPASLRHLGHNTHGYCQARWDQVCVAMDFASLRYIVHGEHAFLATFASQPMSDADVGDFAVDDSCALGADYRPELPDRLISPRMLWTVWTQLSDMVHGADEKHGNVSMFRRHKVVDAATGQTVWVPFIAGNAVRGMWRDLIMGRWLGLLGLKSTEIPSSVAHALFAGGCVEAGADGAGVNLAVRRRSREMCPPWDLFAGCLDQQIMAGRGVVADANPLIRETAWKYHRLLSDAGIVKVGLDEWRTSLKEGHAITTLQLMTRQKHAELQGGDTAEVQMLVNTERVVEGTQWMHRLTLRGIDEVPEVTQACLADLLQQFRDTPFIGAGAARGCGELAFDPYRAGEGTPELPSAKVYLDYVSERRDEMRAWVLRTAEEDAPKPKRAVRGKGKAEAVVEAVV